MTEATHFVTINGNDISKYSIVVSDDASDNILRLAQKLAAHIEVLAGVKLPIITDDTAELEYEIVLGRTKRAASEKVWADYELDAEDGRRYAVATVGNALVITAGNGYGIEDGVKIILEEHLGFGSDSVSDELSVEGGISYTGLSKFLKPNGRSVDYSNVDIPKVFTEDFAEDRGYFTEDNGTSYWWYSNGKYSVSKGKNRAAYVHVYEADVDLTAKLSCTDAGGKGDMALLCRCVSAEAYVKAGYDFGDGEWYIEYREGLDFYTFRVASVKAAVANGNAYTVRFVLDGKHAELYVDGEKLLSAGGIRHFTPGRIGVFANDVDVCADSFKAVLLSGEGTVMKNITHTNFEKYKEGNGASFYELSDGSIYLFIPSGYDTNYRSFDSGKTWVKEPDNIFGTTDHYAQVLKLTDGDYIKIATKKVGEDGVFVSYISSDEGKTWTEGGAFASTRYKDTVAGASIMNDKITQAPNTGRIFFVVTYSTCGEYVEGVTNFCQYYYSDDKGKTWTKSETDSKDIEGLEGIYRYAESKIIECADGTLRVYTTWGGLLGCMHYSESTDGGKTWGPNVLMPEMYCPSSSYQIARDPYAENDHTYYMVWVYAVAFSRPSINHRNRLALVKSTDGKNWEYLGDLWRWECANSHHTGPLDLNQIVNPTIFVSKDAIFVSSGISEFLRPDGSAGTHGFQQHHMWVLDKASLPMGKPMNRFTDVKVGAEYYNAVTFVTEKGILDGVGENTFAPDAVLDCHMLFAVLDRLSGGDGAKYISDTDDAVTVKQLCDVLCRLASSKASGVCRTTADGIFPYKNCVSDLNSHVSRALAAMILQDYVNNFG